MTISLSALVVLALAALIVVSAVTWAVCVRTLTRRTLAAFSRGYSSYDDNGSAIYGRRGLPEWAFVRGWVSAMQNESLKKLRLERMLKDKSLEPKVEARMTIQVDSDNIARALHESQEQGGAQ